MVPENIVWAFYSAAHYAKMADEALLTGKLIQPDTYYKDTNGRWVKVTAVFECIEVARKTYKYNDAKYLGAVQVNTKAEVGRGGVWPTPETISQQVSKKKRLAPRPGFPGTIAVKKLRHTNTFEKFQRHYTYWYEDNY